MPSNTDVGSLFVDRSSSCCNFALKENYYSEMGNDLDGRLTELSNI